MTTMKTPEAPSPLIVNDSAQARTPQTQPSPNKRCARVPIISFRGSPG